MPKVSIILPIYNVENYLRECLESVIHQTLRDIEIICVNDGSTDSSLQIVEEYADKDDRIVVISGPNGGYGKAMNKGLDAARGTYIGIVEPDDYISLDMYEYLCEIAQKYDAEVVKADFYRFTREKNGNTSMVYNHLSNKEEDYFRIIDPREEMNSFRFIMNTWSGIYRRDFLNEFNIRHHETPSASYQDNGFWFQSFCHTHKLVIANKPLYRNRRDNINSSMFNRGKVYCMNHEYEYIRSFLIKEGIWDVFKYIYSVKKYHNYMGTLNRIAFEYKKQYVMDISEEFKIAAENDELDETFFLENEWKSINFLISNPEEYYNFNILRSAREKDKDIKIGILTNELNEIKSSTTYRVGRFIMFIPCQLKECLKKING